MRIEKIMSTPVVFTQKSVKISHLKDMFARKKINAVPVIDDDGIISGIITYSDLVAIHNDNLLVQDILTPKVHICLKNKRVKDAPKTMVKHNVHHLIVMEDDDVVGTVSSMDIVNVYAEE
jgi:predicted transcriptional regulator